MRIMLYTGKGGVGKTSVAAATALLAAERGYKTIVMSTDPAHSLADSLEVSLSGEPTPVLENLWGQEIDVLHAMDKYWRTVQEWLAALMRWQGADEVLAEELAVLPGMEELMALLYVTRHYRDGFYDLVVVDCAPTGETLRLLSFPDMAHWYMRRLFPLERKVAAAVGPLARTMLRIPVPGRKVFDSIQELYSQLEEMRTLLMDASTSSVRLVVNPEKMVIKEAQRTFTYLNLYGYQTDLIVCNRVLPQEIQDSYFVNWKETQSRYLEEIYNSFKPVPVLQAPFMDREVVGQEMLRKMGGHIFNGKDPVPVLYQGQTQEITKSKNGHLLTVRLPFVSREQLSIIESGGELVVQVAHYRRNIVLPRMLAGLTVEEARIDGDVLKISFKEKSKSNKS